MIELGSLSSTRRRNEIVWSLFSTGEVAELDPRPGQIKLGSFECGGVVNLAGPREGEGRPESINSPGSVLDFNPSSTFTLNISSSLLRLRSDKVSG